MHPLEDMKTLLGGTEEDACFAMPSPFPRENLLIHQLDVNTRYRFRDAACGDIAAAIRAMVEQKPGKYIAFFPSFAYLRQVSEMLDMPHQAQRSGMTDEERAELMAYLNTEKTYSDFVYRTYLDTSDSTFLRELAATMNRSLELRAGTLYEKTFA